MPANTRCSHVMGRHCFIETGESPAAMQHGCSARQLSSAALFLFSVAAAVAVNVKAQRHVWSFIYGVT